MIPTIILALIGAEDNADILGDYSLCTKVCVKMAAHKAMVRALSQHSLDAKTFLGRRRTSWRIHRGISGGIMVAWRSM
jgi:hypothetical protein